MSFTDAFSVGVIIGLGPRPRRTYMRAAPFGSVMSANAAPPAPSAPAAPSPEPTVSPSGPVTGANPEREALIIKELKKIYDPEIPMNIVDLGLIYGFEWHGDDVVLKMTLTAPGCPVAGILA